MHGTDPLEHRFELPIAVIGVWQQGARPAQNCDYTLASGARGRVHLGTLYQRTTCGISGCRASAFNCWVTLRVTRKVPSRQPVERGEIHCRGMILPGTIFSSLLLSITYVALFLGPRDPTCHSHYRGFVRSVRKPLRCQPNSKSVFLSKFGPFVSSVGNSVTSQASGSTAPQTAMPRKSHAS